LTPAPPEFRICAMNQSQYATPLLIKNGKAAPLHRIVFDDDFRDENWLQQLLFDHPHLIPFDEIEPAFTDRCIKNFP